MRLPVLGTLSTSTLLTLLLASSLTACGGRSTGVPNDDDPSSMRMEGEEDPTGSNGSQSTMESSGMEGTSASSGMTGAGTGSSGGVIALAGASSGTVTGMEVMNGDGSTTTVVTEPDGTVITTTTLPDGSVTSTITAPDGSVIGTSGSGGAAGVSAGVPVSVGRPPPPIMIGPIGAAGGANQGEPLVECVPEYQGSGPQSCEIGLACENGYAWSSCWHDGTDWRCDCQANGGYASIVIPDVDADNPCAYSVDVCASGLDLDQASERQCTPTYQEEGDRYCNLETECRSALETEDGVDLQVLQYESVWCENSGSEWDCGCNQGASSYNISLQHDAAGVCSTVRDICSAGPIQPEGGYDCERSYMSASTTWCDASLECGQTAVVDGTTIQVNGYAYVNCQPGEEGVWQCYCEGLGTGESFEISSDDEWDTCNDASAQCAEMISGQ